MENKKYTIGYLDEEEQWRLIARDGLISDFNVSVLDLPPSPFKIWDEIIENKLDAMIVDFRLFENGIVTYTGKEIIDEVRRHNRHFPLFIMTSYENDAFSQCEDVLIIRDKRMFNNNEELSSFKMTLKALLDSYYKKENLFRKRLLQLNKLETLNKTQKEEKFEIELYLAELDQDNSIPLNLLSSGYNESMDTILKLAREISCSLKKQ